MNMSFIKLLEQPYNHTGTIPKLLTLFRETTNSELRVLCGQVISLWTPNQDMLKNQRLAYFMSYCRRLSCSSSSLDLDISTCIDTIKTMITGKERITVKEVSKMESIVFEQEQQGHKIERVEALERYLFGTCRPSHS